MRNDWNSEVGMRKWEKGMRKSECGRGNSEIGMRKWDKKAHSSWLILFGKDDGGQKFRKLIAGCRIRNAMHLEH
ncbi:hypothetical protein JY97_16685 [Alkalispirochaeta odontotermitis]|nr:hypothetical protein JY97_16685 [Alkalispirochaeta odontotermitis]CAB1079690.1 hypothetical protein D1AOALGA4SA_7398 [Olavius algarvensis Delta 1 endosymbiont]